MKIKVKMKSKPKTEPVEETKSSSLADGWAVRGDENVRQKYEEQKALSKSSQRPPEIWIPNGESKLIRFRTNEPVSIFRYNVRFKGNWVQFTAPAEGEEDLFRTVLGLEPQLKFVYEVIDIDGYKSKKDGKVHKNIPRYYNIGGRVYDTIEKIKSKRGPLTGYNIEISRTGEKTDTTYTCLPETPSPMTIEMKKAPSLMQEFAKWYAPLSFDEMQSVVNALGRVPDSE